MLKRVWYYVTRKRIKSLIMLFVLFGIATSMISGIAIKKAATTSKEKMYENIGAGFSIQNNLQYNMGNSRGVGNVPEKMINEIANLNGVTKCVKRLEGIAQLIDVKFLELPQNNSSDMSDIEKKYPGISSISGIDYSSIDSKFTSGALTLTQGRHLQEGNQYQALIHEDFAKANGLKIGDTLKMKASEYDLDNKNPYNGIVETEIVGLFSGKNPNRVAYKEELYENIIITDLDTIRKIYNYTEKNTVYHNATFFTNSPQEVETVMAQAKKLPGDWKNYMLVEEKSEYIALSKSAEGLNGLVNAMLIGTFVIGVVILSLILFLWIHGRKHETGIFMALGISKVKIILQYVLELLFIAVISFTLAFFAGRAVAQSIGDNFVKQSSQSAVNEVKNSVNGGMLGTDIETSAILKTIDKIDVSISPSDMAIVWGIGILVIIISVSVASIPIIRMKPKEILSQMS